MVGPTTKSKNEPHAKFRSVALLLHGIEAATTIPAFSKIAFLTVLVPFKSVYLTGNNDFTHVFPFKM